MWHYSLHSVKPYEITSQVIFKAGRGGAGEDDKTLPFLLMFHCAVCVPSHAQGLGWW